MNICKKDRIIMGMIVVLIIIVSANLLKYYIEKRESPRVQALLRDKEFMEGDNEKSPAETVKAVIEKGKDLLNNDQKEESNIIEESSTTGSSAITVDIEGAVKKPGVYEINVDARMNELIEKAGGFTEDAQTKGINKAKKLKDEGYYYVPTVGEESEVAATVQLEEEKEEKEGKIDINSASIGKLMEIPGVGEVRAGEIIKYREQNGGFKSIDDMKNISGIGEKTYQKMRDMIYVP